MVKEKAEKEKRRKQKIQVLVKDKEEKTIPTWRIRRRCRSCWRRKQKWKVMVEEKAAKAGPKFEDNVLFEKKAEKVTSWWRKK